MQKTFKGGHRSGIYQATKKTWKVGVPMDVVKTTDNLIGLLCYWGQHQLCEPITKQGECTCDCHKDMKTKGKNNG